MQLSSPNPIAKAFIERIQTGLARKSVQSCSRWATQYRVMDKPIKGNWSFEQFPWLKDMHDSTAKFNIGQKSAQMGYTETLLNVVFYNIDVRHIDVLYVLPNKSPDAADFSASRFDPAVELSKHITSMFTNVKNIGHKRAGTCNIYIRGSKSRAGLKSVPVGLLCLDEVDEMPPENLSLAFERLSGQPNPLNWLVSTPTIDGFGINFYFKDSTAEHFFFKCPHCSKLTELIYPDCLVITSDEIGDPRLKDSHYICKECKSKLHQESKKYWLSNGIWVPSQPDKISRGFHINQMYSWVIEPWQIAEQALLAETNAADEQELYNSKLGLPHVVAEARVTEDQIIACRGKYDKDSTLPTPGLIVTMGIDVGKWLHYEIDEWWLPDYYNSTDLNAICRCRVLSYGKKRDIEEINELMDRYSVRMAVMDAQPERRKAYEFVSQNYGRAAMCFYIQGMSGKQIHLSDDAESRVTVDRTSWLDLSMGRFKNKSITVPGALEREYIEHIKAPVRINKKRPDGSIVSMYISTSPDHYAHARTYAEIAMPLAANIGSSIPIRNVL